MFDYRLYYVSLHTGHFTGVEEYVAPDDAAAIQLARRYARERAGELWSKNRKVARIEPEPIRAAGCSS